MTRNLLSILMLASMTSLVQAGSSLETWTALMSKRYNFIPNIVYKRASNFECKLDVIMARDTSRPRPTLLFIHGGGWIQDVKENRALIFLPYLARGMNVVNIEYRLSDVALAPAAVEDSRCALRWIYVNAKEYGFDVNRLVVSGWSAGGHLSLMTGMLTPEAGFDNECPRGKGYMAYKEMNEDLKVAAVVNVYGITDVADLLEGPNRQNYAVRWLGSMRDRAEVARSVSPLEYVRPDLPPILTIHGDADTTVPYEHAVRLHKALNRVGAKNQLLTIPGAGHGLPRWSDEEILKSHRTIFSFLEEHGILSKQ